MKIRNIAISILIGLFLVTLPAATAQYLPQGGGQFYVNQPYNAAQPGYIMPPASMAPNEAASAAPNANMNFGQQTYPYTAPWGAPAACAAAPLAATCGPVAAPCGASACGPFTAGFTYSAQQASAFGPFTPPVTQAAEQFYQYPGLTPYGPYPGAGYTAAGGVGFDPATGYYGPYGGVMPLA